MDLGRCFLAVLVIGTFSVAACHSHRAGPAETAGQKVDSGIQKMGEKMEEGGQKLQDKAREATNLRFAGIPKRRGGAAH
jgi:hypothetical protein